MRALIFLAWLFLNMFSGVILLLGIEHQIHPTKVEMCYWVVIIAFVSNMWIALQWLIASAPSTGHILNRAGMELHYPEGFFKHRRSIQEDTFNRTTVQEDTPHDVYQ